MYLFIYFHVIATVIKKLSNLKYLAVSTNKWYFIKVPINCTFSKYSFVITRTIEMLCKNYKVMFSNLTDSNGTFSHFK